MKSIKLSIICTAALLMALPFSGCMHADSGNAEQKATELTYEVTEEQPAENECPDKDDKCPDGKCPKNDDDCPDGKCPKRRIPRGRKGKHRKAVILPCPVCGDEN